jgi:hypothetical protein
MAAFVLALVRVRTVNLTQVALGMNPGVEQSSNYRRIQRFFEGFEVCQLKLAVFLLSFLDKPEGGWIVSLDRTEWEFGKQKLNVMMLGVVYQGLTLPLVWLVLDKDGNSNTDERKALTKQLLLVLPAEQIGCLVADREFIGQGWWRWLKLRKVKFCIRIKENACYAKGRLGKVKHLFTHLKIAEYEILSKTYPIYGNRVRLVGMRLKTQWLILATTADPSLALAAYRQRWTIENLFSAMKTRGFNFEDTHLTHPDRIEKLVAMMAIALVWCLLIGQWQATINELKLKKHGRKPKSLFRRGLDFLRNALLFPKTRKLDLDSAFRLLSCT